MVQENLTHRVNSIQNTAMVIANSLEEKIYAAEIEPGQQLVQENIAKMFGVSRVPVRDALQILINKGLAVSVPRRGVFVRRLSKGLLDELFEVRKILEGAAIRIVVNNITNEVIQLLKDIVEEQKLALQAGNVQGNEQLDTKFHEIIFNLLNNQTLIDLILANWARIRQARCTSTVDSGHGKKWIEESINRHIRLLEVLDARDSEAAQQTVIDNIESSQNEITNSLKEMGWLDANHGTLAY